MFEQSKKLTWKTILIVTNADMNKHNNRQRVDESAGTQTAMLVKMINVKLRAHICKIVSF